MNNVCATFVRYNFSKKKILRSINNIKKQVKKVYLIDNSRKKIHFKDKKIKYIFLGENYGIAHAQNYAIFQAIKDNFKFILLSDQDTIYPKNYLKNLIPFFKQKNVSAICPNLFDTNKNKPLGLISRFLFLKQTLNNEYNIKQKSNDLKFEYITESMASGTVIKLHDIKDIGYMNDDLYLDWVDFEWCWKLNKKNKKMIGIKNLFAKHKLGSSKTTIFNKIYHRHSLLRYFYIIRNGVILTFYGKGIKFFWRINIFFNTIKYFFGALIINNFYPKSIKIISKAFLIGLLNKKGKLMKS
jgi:rhamnosyltransferase